MPYPKQDTKLGLTQAVIDLGDSSPRAPGYGDVYFSADDGLAESRHVFIDGNDLRGRLATWRETRPFVIGETGFGTGRNVLVACRTFLEAAPPKARLHMISIERHPLRKEDLIMLWRNHGELATHAARLIKNWPEPIRGTHRLQLADRVVLDLIMDDVEPALRQFDGRVDAWFLDGFAPNRNPGMWSQSVFHRLAAASRPGATFATYTCARQVRDHGATAGFACHKRPGAGPKRDMLRGDLTAEFTANTTASERVQRPWFKPPAPIGGGSIAIIGGGIAGSTVAEALARRGTTCDLYDPCGGPGGASGNAQGALHIRPAANGDARTRFYLAALAYTRRWLALRDPEQHLWSDCGLLQLAFDDEHAGRQKRCLEQLGLPASMAHWIGHRAAADLAALPLSASVRGGLYFPQSGWVRPAALCHELLSRSDATVYPTAVNAVQRSRNQWRLACANGHVADYTHVVFACAHHASRLCDDLPPMDAVRGQISTFAANAVHTQPASVVCGRGSVMPSCHGRLHVGASFVRGVEGMQPRAAEDQANRDLLAEITPTGAQQLDSPVESRVAFRCTSYDRLPYVGPIPDSQTWRRDYAKLALDARRIPKQPGTCRPGLWASLAHGGNGLVGAPLAAEALVSRMLDEPLPLTATAMDALHPGRWLIRELIRGR